MPITKDYDVLLNLDEEEDALTILRNSVNKGKPFGSDNWIEKIAEKLKLKSTLNPRGRPKKGPDPFSPPNMPENLKEKIKKVRNSIVAIGFSPAQNQITITGSGFCISDDGKILTAAHIYNQTPTQFQSKLLSMVMTQQEANGLEHYVWLPLTFIKKEDKNDIALFQITDYKKTLLKPLEVGDSEKIEVGQEAYFIGFPYAAQLMNDGFGITLTVNRTIISNIKRDGIDPTHPQNWFIVDAISNPGNSGGPLLDAETNKVIGLMTIAFRTKSQVSKYNDLDIREPMHIAGAKPINLAKLLL